MRPTTGMRRWSLRYSRSEASVSIDMEATPRGDLSRHEIGGRRLEERRQVPLGVDLAGEDVLAVIGSQLRQGGGNRRLAHAAFAGDEDQLELEEVRSGRAHVARRRPRARRVRVRRTRHGAPRSAPPPRCRPPWPRARRPGGPCLSVSHSTPSPALSSFSMSATTLSRSASSFSSTSSSLGVWMIPMRTST